MSDTVVSLNHRSAGLNVQGSHNAQPINQEIQIADEHHPVAEVSNQLTQLLDRVSKRSTTAVNISEIKDAADGNRALRKLKPYKNLFKLADTAQKNLHALNGFCGNDIIQAYSPADGGTWSGIVGQQINAAIKAQSDLSSELLTLLNDPVVTRDADLQALIEEKYFQSCCRESELITVLTQIATLKEGDQELSAADTQALSRTFNDWMSKAATQLHGTSDHVSIKDVPALAELNTLLSELKGSDEALTPELRQRITTAVQHAQVHIHSIATKNETIDKSFFKNAERYLNAIHSALGNLRTVTINSITSRHIETCIAPPKALTFSNALIEQLSKSPLACEFLQTFLRMLNNNAHRVQEYVALRKAPNTPIEALNARRAELLEINKSILSYFKNDVAIFNDLLDKEQNAIVSEIKHLAELVKVNKANALNPGALSKSSRLPPNVLSELSEKLTYGDFRNALTTVLKNLHGFVHHLNALDKIIDNALLLGDDDTNTKHIITSLFQRELPISALVECRVNGIRDGDFDPALCDDNVQSFKAFGQGKANTVYEVTMKDGSVYIFKPEVTSRAGVGDLFVAKGAYENDINIGLMNIATHDAADFLGCGSVITKAKAGVFNGQLGIFMEKAPGVEAQKIKNAHTHPSQAPENAALPDFDQYDDETFIKVNGQLMKKSYDLAWVDGITASNDRHSSNYLVHINDQHEVTLKGIDNDMTFGKYNTNFNEFTLSNERFKDFIINYMEILSQHSRRKIKADKVCEDLNKLDGITIDQTKNIAKIEIDKVKDLRIRRALAKTTGSHRYSPPSFISRELYNRFVELNNDPNQMKAYRQRLANRMHQVNVDAAMARLRSAIHYALQLPEDHIIDNWQDVHVQKHICDAHKAKEEAFISPQRDAKNYNVPRLKAEFYFRDFGEITPERITAIAEQQK